MAEVSNDIRKALSTPKNTFQQGIIDTDYDTGLGFVSDLKNMEINRGIAKRRLGTKVLNNTDNVVLWRAFHRTTIGGTSVHLQINEKQELYAWLDKWTEVDFKVCERKFSTGEHIIFSNKSSKYWFIEDNKYIYIISDFGEIYRINKFGSIFMAEEVTSVAEWKPKQMRDNIRFSTATPAMYLDIDNFTYNRIDNFNAIEEIDKSVVPVLGDVRVAPVNEAGYIGKFSEPIFFPDYKRILISMEDGLTGARTRIFNLESTRFEPTFIDLINNFDSDSSKLFIERTTTMSETDWNNNEASNNSFTYNVPVIFNPLVGFGSTIKARIIVSDGYFPHMYFDAYADGNVATNHSDLQISSNLANFINFSNVKFIDVVNSGVTAADFTDSDKSFAFDELVGQVFKISTTYGADASSPVPILGTGGYTFATNTLSGNINGGAHTHYFYQMFLDESAIESAAPISKQTFLYSDGTNSITVNGWLLEADVNVRTTSVVDNNFEIYKLESTALKFDEGWIRSSAYLFNNIGYDCWDITPDKIESTDILSADPKSLIINSTNRKIDVLIRSSSIVSRFITDGTMFAVWNDGKIKSISQVGWKTNANRITYDYNDASYTAKDLDDSNTGRNVNQTPEKFTKTYVPITRMEYQSLRSFSFEINELLEHIENPQHIVGNSGKIFVIQGQRLWLGNIANMLLEFPVEIDFNVNFMEKFYSGVIMFTDKGIYRCDDKGNVNHVSDEIAKAATDGKGGAFFINTDDEVYSVTMVYQDNIPFPQLTNISNSIYSVNWGSSPKMIHFDNALWIARDDDIYCYDQGAWTKRYVYDNRLINNISYFNNELVVAFQDSNKVSDYIETFEEEAGS